MEKKDTHTPDLLSRRFTSRPSSPLKVAIRHLRRRRIAMICFYILVAYFLVAAVTFLRVPDWTTKDAAGIEVKTDHRFVGEWFEALATRPLVDDEGVPIDYYPPTLAAPRERDVDGYRTGETIKPWWKEQQNREATRASRFHFILGTDIQGRSVLWKTLYGARMSLTIAAGASLLAVLIGTTLGALAGYLGGRVDVVVTWLFTTVASVPRILLIMAMAYALKNEVTIFGLTEPFRLSGMVMLILAMGLTSWVSLCRLIRGEVLKQKSMDYESAARALGLGRIRILVRHLLPNVFYLVIIQVSLIFPLFIHLEVILSYLGLGATEGVSWGQMINASMLELMQTPKVWWQLVSATVAIFGISLALNLFGDALRDALDPKLQNLSD